MRTVILLTILVLSSCSAASSSPMLAISAVPGGDPGCSSPTGLPGTGVVCPLGDYGWFDVTVVDPGGTPNDLITCGATSVAGRLSFCPGTNPMVAPLGPALLVTFRFKTFGGCDKILFMAKSSDGTMAGPTPPIFVTSFDENGSLMVDAIDLAIFGADYGMAGRPCSDFNCDGRVNALDLALFGRHYGHACIPTQ